MACGMGMFKVSKELDMHGYPRDSSPQPNRGLVSTFTRLRWSLRSNHYLSRISRKLYRVLGESLLQSLVLPMAPIKYRVAMMLETLPLQTLHHLLPNSHSCRLCKPSDDRAAQRGRMRHCFMCTVTAAVSPIF